MKQITGVEGWNKARRQVPRAGPPPHVQEKNEVLQIDCEGSLSHILAFYVRCKCSVEFSEIVSTLVIENR